ncbi:uncharacterized protein V1516DRAFT_681503 [Lipomyces oligophaga]|uniref:uncharacterized protein n=1 Tax=Lipomyces oligophaga TaxID=45792 RepID=UPI0034CFDFAF
MLFRRSIIPAARCLARNARPAYAIPSVQRLPLAAKRFASSRIFPRSGIIPKDVPLLEWERQLILLFEKNPIAAEQFKTEDGSWRIPTDEEFAEFTELDIASSDHKQSSQLSRDQRLAILEKAKAAIASKSQTEKDFEFLNTAGPIVDKVPVVDHHGVVTYDPVLKSDDSGWQGIVYYLYVPLLTAFSIFGLFFQENKSELWALEELRLQAEEKYLQSDAIYNSLTPEQQAYKQVMIVNSILAGDFDKLVSH